MEQKLIQIGNSAGIVIPRDLRKQIGLKPGDRVVVETDVSGHALVVRPKGKRVKGSSVTPEFLSWLERFNKRYAKALEELARK